MFHFFLRGLSVFALAFTLVIARPVLAQPTYNVDVPVANGNKPIPQEIWGMNLQGYLGQNVQPHMNSYADFMRYITNNGELQTNIPALQTAAGLMPLGIKVIRFPGGGAARAYNWGGGVSNAYLALGATQVPFMRIRDGLQLSSAFGANLLYQANLSSPLNQPASNCQELANIISYVPDHYDQAARRSFIRYIEMGHDEWLSGNPALYQQIVSTCSHVIKTIDPTIKIGLVGYGSLDESANAVTQRAAWNAMLATILPDPTCGPTNTVPCYDFVTDRIYPRAIHSSYTPPFLGQTTFYSTANMTLNSPNPINPAAPLSPLIINQSIRPGTPVAFTEWNLACENNPFRGTPVTAAGTVEHGLFTALTLFDMLGGGVPLAAFHDLTIDGTFAGESGCGFLTRNSNNGADTRLKLSAAAQAFQLTSVAAGGTLLNASPGVHNNLLNIPANINPVCTARDCLDIGTNGLNNVSHLKTYAVRQGNDMYVFLINRDANQNNTFNATIKYNLFTNFTPTVNITANYLIGIDYQRPIFDEQFQQICSGNACQPGQVSLPVPAASILRVRIENYFLNAPLPTPTPLVPPNSNITEIIKIINSKRPPVKQCVPEILPYIFAAFIYIMVTWLAIEISEWWKQVTLVMYFVVGGVIGYFLCNMTAGFVFAMVMTLFLW